jgi:hypothetical protein
MTRLKQCRETCAGNTEQPGVQPMIVGQSAAGSWNVRSNTPKSAVLRL